MIQGSLFDEQMRVQAEQSVWWAEDLRRQLTAAEARLTAVERERDALRQRLAEMERAARDADMLERVRQGLGLPARGAGDRGRLLKALTHLAAEVHPDRWQGSPVAEECTKAVLRLRDTLMP